MRKVSKNSSPRCQQTKRGWVGPREERPECGKRAIYKWESDLRGEMYLCNLHAKAVGIEKCHPIEPENF